MKWSAFALSFVLAIPAALAAQSGQVTPAVRFYTTLGNIDVQLLSNDAPKTVTNFLNYVNRGAYNGTFIHRSVHGFVIQGGAYTFKNGQVQTFQTDPPVVNEFKVSNTRGTLAMAKLNGDPNSATSQWFFNESDANAANLDSQNGGFTVFGRVADAAGLAVMDNIAAAPVPAGAAPSPFDELPLLNYNPTLGVQASNLIYVDSIKITVASTAPDYTISASPTALTIPRGQSATVTLTVQPLNGYHGTIAFSCGVLPSSASCSFSPASVTFAASATAAQQVTLTVRTTTAAMVGLPSGSGRTPSVPTAPLVAIAAALVALALATRLADRPRLRLATFGSAAALVTITACGGSDSTSPAGNVTPAGTYNVPIAITDGNVSHPVNVSIVVQ